MGSIIASIFILEIIKLIVVLLQLEVEVFIAGGSSVPVSINDGELVPNVI